MQCLETEISMEDLEPNIIFMNNLTSEDNINQTHAGNYMLKKPT